MNWNLVVAQGLHKGKVVPLNQTRFLIGRDEKCHLRPANPSVSQRHCMLTVAGSRLLLRDLHSTNGTFINGQPVKADIELHDGDALVVGPLEFKVRWEDQKALTKESSSPAASAPVDPVDEDTVAAYLLEMDEETHSQPEDPDDEI
jgi:pSer/pThr/pTyr-binding forkhead associated (FHA) protein